MQNRTIMSRKTQDFLDDYFIDSLQANNFNYTFLQNDDIDQLSYESIEPRQIKRLNQLLSTMDNIKINRFVSAYQSQQTRTLQQYVDLVISTFLSLQPLLNNLIKVIDTTRLQYVIININSIIFSLNYPFDQDFDVFDHQIAQLQEKDCNQSCYEYYIIPIQISNKIKAISININGIISQFLFKKYINEQYLSFQLSSINLTPFLYQNQQNYQVRYFIAQNLVMFSSIFQKQFSVAQFITFDKFIKDKFLIHFITKFLNINPNPAYSQLAICLNTASLKKYIKEIDQFYFIFRFYPVIYEDDSTNSYPDYIHNSIKYISLYQLQKDQYKSKKLQLEPSQINFLSYNLTADHKFIYNNNPYYFFKRNRQQAFKSLISRFDLLFLQEAQVIKDLKFDKFHQIIIEINRKTFQHGPGIVQEIILVRKSKFSIKQVYYLNFSEYSFNAKIPEISYNPPTIILVQYKKILITLICSSLSANNETRKIQIQLLNQYILDKQIHSQYILLLGNWFDKEFNGLKSICNCSILSNISGTQKNLVDKQEIPSFQFPSNNQPIWCQFDLDSIQ
ncbi:hypothetical protein SS50377_25769 [Spironucleus salmonicida]|uniref:Endonuclease/exonuclease/phosphatase domain-containing protein n=1 Tax=Spironucleus salmonicida TaxID=348837 RepID=A0A9P8RWC8_9EUKA|nr:hypothetical protein SS50377_25769 [Spironucleus salmonicida]